MSELHKHTNQTVYLDIYGGVADALPVATLTAADGTTRDLSIEQDAPPTGIDDRYHVVLTMADTQNEGDIKVTWEFSINDVDVEKVDQFSVVTPYLSISEIKDILGEDATDDEAREAEAGVRHIINAHCGQTFGKFVGKRSITGSGDTNLRMPQRLISYSTINGNAYWNDILALRGGGWFLSRKHVYAPSIRADFDGWHQDPNSGVITAPYSRAYGTFQEHFEYEIDGIWGWESVPEPVKAAAKLLVNDYACGDSLYRDRFLTSMTAADWRIQFHEGAFSNTGNVRANQLLAEFVLRRGWVVI